MGYKRKDLTPGASGIWEGTWILLTGGEWAFLEEKLELSYSVEYQWPTQDIWWRYSALSAKEQSSERSEAVFKVA